MTIYIIEVDFGTLFGHEEYRIYAKSLDEAAQWAEDNLEIHGYNVTRIRPSIDHNF